MTNPIRSTRVRWAVLAAASAVALVACSSSASSPSEDRDDADTGAGGGQTLNVTGFSGAFADQFQETVIDPFVEANPGVTVNYQPSQNSAEMLAALRTNQSTATYDVVVIDSSVQRTANSEGLFSELGPADVPNLEQLVDTAVVDPGYGPALYIDSLAIIYNPDIIAEPPSTWSGLADPAYDGQLVLQIADTRGIALIAGLAKELGLDYQDGIDPELEVLREMAPYVQTWEPQPNLYDAIMSGSAGIGVGWNARAQALHDANEGLLDVVVPEGGGVAQISTINQVANSENPELAQAFIDFAIGEQAQQALAAEGYYGPVNQNVTLDDELTERVASPDGLLADAAPIDWAWISPHYAEWTERIQREVIGG